jgi:hypothetical protein
MDAVSATILTAASHRLIRMAIEITSNSPAFFVVANLLFAHNVS